MKYLLQVDFAYAGPWGVEMTHAMQDLAASIATEKGLIWKIWTEDEASGRAGGVYLFQGREEAQAYLDMHAARLATFGISEVRGLIFVVNEPLSAIDRAPL
ncbi:monooxygenase [Stenotrophomonas sp. ATCM1_4]|nr:monooxygenase [Stenotrophomonas sp. ATCM1_4]TDB27478.1 monooxygenase [Stenotrophomonas sp. ATCM1_4]